MDMGEIMAEINRIEAQDVTYADCTKLAILYSIVDHYKPDKTARTAASSSEFLQAFQMAPREKAEAVIDEHMNAIKTLYPREYSAIIQKLNNL